jgi:hypothetical protein
MLILASGFFLIKVYEALSTDIVRSKNGAYYSEASEPYMFYFLVTVYACVGILALVFVFKKSYDKKEKV